MKRALTIFLTFFAPDMDRAFLLRQELTTTAVGPKGVTQDLRRTATIIILTVAKGNKTETGLDFGLRSFPFFVANVHILLFKINLIHVKLDLNIKMYLPVLSAQYLRLPQEVIRKYRVCLQRLP
ncbi:hypothetical protein ALC57_11340 [Trachymyrmex cornetzi]|uniref:Uncharacterized protein n=1 Tax=Trachymyrmex cornetzi TaxID=471704 RepID=A0A195DU88_9HYME|nr:hypothetical protein ALC57_11340 [Trachymyrmex cornetzi]